MNKLLIISGPSGVGKSPLLKAFNKLYPNISKNYKKLILYNSRSARPNEVDGDDYYFRTKDYLNSLRTNKNYLVFDVRDDIQALDINELLNNLHKNNLIFEGNPFVGSELIKTKLLRDVERLSIFISPLSLDEILFFKNNENIILSELITDLMRRKLLKRAQKQKGILSIKDLENIETRAKSAYEELKLSINFDFVVPNHDGEDSDHWDTFYYPIGDARKTLMALVDLLENNKSSFAEKWNENLL
ncbi:MAG: guanylate kinase [Rikenellaceae bacterium]|nr:guanylate kinase [Rikenellaceae bacterium]